MDSDGQLNKHCLEAALNLRERDMSEYEVELPTFTDLVTYNHAIYQEYVNQCNVGAFSVILRLLQYRIFLKTILSNKYHDCFLSMTYFLPNLFCNQANTSVF